MRWGDVRTLVKGKLNGKVEPGKKHDQGWVPNAEGIWIGRISIGRHGEMKPREIGNCARSLFISEGAFKELERCNMTRQEFLDEVQRLTASRF